MAALFRGQDEIAQKIADRVALSPIAGQVEGPFDLVYGENVRPGTVRPPDDNLSVTGAIPRKCVFVVATTSQEPTYYMGGAWDVAATDVSDWPADFVESFQIVCRGDVDDDDGAYNLCDAVFRALDNGTTDGYYSIQAIQRPTFLRRDELGCYEYIFNIQARRCQ